MSTIFWNTYNIREKRNVWPFFRVREKWPNIKRKLQKIDDYADSFEAVFTYKISRNDVGIMINNAVAVNPKILTSIK